MTSLTQSLSQSRQSLRSSSPVKDRSQSRSLNLQTDSDDESSISDIEIETPHTSFESRSKSRNSGRSEKSLDKSSHRQSLARFNDSSREISTSSGRQQQQQKKNRSYIRLESDLREKQREISALESIVEELNGELQSSQAKLSSLFEKTQKSRDHQRAEMERWRRDQLNREQMMISPESYDALNEKLVECSHQLDAVHEERHILMEELERANQKTRQLQADRRELKETIEHFKDEVKVRDENIDRLQGRLLNRHLLRSSMKFNITVVYTVNLICKSITLNFVTCMLVVNREIYLHLA